jgi:S-(hydroxymethyl)glutathione dehydrogenase / alcohol dehydrogenase
MLPVGSKLELDGADLLWERKIQGCMMGSNRFRIDMPRFVEFYLNGKLHLDDMISRHIKLADVNDAFEAMKTGEEARQVIMFD